MNRTLLLTTLFVVFVAAAITHADIIQIAIEARVSQVYDPANLLEDNIAPDDFITGTYTYNSDTPDTNPSNSEGEYWYYSAPYGINLLGGGFVFQTDILNTEFKIGIGNNYGFNEEDLYVLQSFNNSPLSNGVGIDHISWQLDDSSGQAISSDTLPLLPPNPEDWNPASNLYIRSEKIDNYSFEITGHVESAVLVPEPGLLCLLSLGVLCLMRRKKH